VTQGYHLAFLKAISASLGLLRNCLPESKWFGHLAIFWLLSNLDKKKYILRPVLDKSEQISHIL